MMSEAAKFSISIPYEAGFYVFEPGVEYHFAYNKGDVEIWGFWVLDYIKPWPEEGDDGRRIIEYYFKQYK